MVFPVVMYGCESWTEKKAERQRTEEPLDESEREEWKSWLKTQHSKN